MANIGRDKEEIFVVPNKNPIEIPDVAPASPVKAPIKEPVPV